MELPNNTIVLSLSDYEAMKEEIKELRKATEDRSVMIVDRYIYSGFGNMRHTKSYESRDSIIEKMRVEIEKIRVEISDNKAMYNLEIGMKDMRIRELENRKWWEVWK